MALFEKLKRRFRGVIETEEESTSEESPDPSPGPDIYECPSCGRVFISCPDECSNCGEREFRNMGQFN